MSDTDVTSGQEAPSGQQPSGQGLRTWAGSLTLTPGQSALWGLGFFSAGALGSGFLTVVWEATRKRAEEDVLEAAARMKAVPVALRALGISTAICGGMAVAAAAAVKVSGLETREVAEVASLADAVAVARQARAVTQAEFRRKREDVMHSASDQ
mmetsp:Transcript_16983/g.43063  ORF Transcript_16983/g.43063 Transcript_16983/m.43063 type:complete len:154 (+) Transcript_16983:271-732(+)